MHADVVSPSHAVVSHANAAHADSTCPRHVNMQVLKSLTGDMPMPATCSIAAQEQVFKNFKYVLP